MMEKMTDLNKLAPVRAGHLKHGEHLIFSGSNRHARRAADVKTSKPRTLPPSIWRIVSVVEAINVDERMRTFKIQIERRGVEDTMFVHMREGAAPIVGGMLERMTRPGGGEAAIWTDATSSKHSVGGGYTVGRPIMARGFGKAGAAAAAAKPWTTQLDLFDDFMPTPATVTPAAVPVSPTVDGPGFDLEDLKRRFAAVRIVPVQSPWFGDDIALGVYSGGAQMSKWSWMHTFALYCLGGRVHTIHPAFDDTAWLEHVAEALGYSPTYDARLSLRKREAEQRFAWEFVSDKTTDELLAHQHLTTPLAIVTAVAGALGRHKPIEADMKLNFENARKILLALGAEEPELGDYSDQEMSDAVVTRDRPEQSDLLDVTWRRIHAWQLELVRYQKGVAVSVCDLVAAA